MSIKTNTKEKSTVCLSNETDKRSSLENDAPLFTDDNALLSLLLNKTKESFLLIDRNFCIQVFNEAARTQAASLFGIELKKGISVYKFISPDTESVKRISQTVLNGESFEIETIHRTENRESYYFLNSFHPYKNETGVIIAVILTSQDISSQRRIELALAESELLWRTALEGSHQGVWDWDLANNKIYYSASYERLYGFQHGELTNDVCEWLNRVHPSDRKNLEHAVHEHYESGKPHYDTIYRIRDKDNSYKWILARGSIISRDSNGMPLRMVGTHTDVTDYKVIEENYKLLFYSNPLPMWTCDPETNRFLDVNEAAITHYGYSHEEFLQMNMLDIQPLQEKVNKDLCDVKHPFSYYFPMNRVKHQKKNGDIIDVDLTRHIIEQDNKKIHLIISQDITEKLLAQQQLQFSEIKYRTLFENNPLPSFIYDTTTLVFLEVNNAAIEHYGYSKEEFSRLSVSDLHPLEEKALVTEAVKNVIPKAFHSSSWKHLKKNGDSIYVDIISSQIFYKNKNARLVVIHDKTAQVITERELLLSNERFRLASLASSEVLWEWNIQTDTLYLSDAYTTIFGWKVTEKTFNEWQYHIHPADRQNTMKEFHDAIANIFIDRWEKEYRYLKSDGNYAYIIDKAFIVRGKNGKAIKVVGAKEDISQQKEAEAVIKLSNERFRLASKATSDAIWDLELSSNNLEWGEGIQTLFGYRINEVTFEKWMKLLHPDDAERVESSLVHAIYHSHDSIWRNLYRFKAADGSYKYVLNRGFILRQTDGKPYRAIGSMQDITDLKEKEKELIISNDRYKYASLATSDIVIDWNISKEKAHLSDNFNKIFGWGLPSDKEIAISDLITHTHPEDRKRVWRDAYAAINNQSCNHWSSNFRYGRSDGTYAIVSLKGYIIRNNEGEGIRMIGAIQDITEKTLKELELTESKDRFDAVLKATHDLIWDWNLETGDFYRGKEGLEKVYGVSNEDCIKNIHNWLLRLHPDDYERVQKLINTILYASEKDTFELEYRFKRDDGHYNYVYDRGRILRNKEGLPVRMIGAAQDITERKKLEKQLLQRELDKQKLISQATIETQERERSEISKELHDNVNQVLTTTKLYLDLSLSNLELKDELIAKSSKNIIYVINEIRQLSRSLMNPSLGDLGLYESINDLIENIHLTGKLKVKVSCDPSLEEELNENQKLMLYRIVQESLNNALKHAKANTVKIQLFNINQTVELSIADDGVGFNFASIKKGAGLKHIQNRVYLANGTLKVNSVPNEGSNILIKFPINSINPI